MLIANETIDTLKASPRISGNIESNGNCGGGILIKEK
jgi:hypothetical protein